MVNIPPREWSVMSTAVFDAWWHALEPPAQDAIDVVVRLLQVRGPHLGFPYSSAVQGSRHGHLRELRVQCRGRPLRVLYAFDPRRVALLLLGGDKTGNDRWYDQHIPHADRLYDEHLRQLRKE